MNWNAASGTFAEAFRVQGQTGQFLQTSSKDVQEKSWSDIRSISGRFRNSLFGSAFVKTLGLMADEDKRWTVQKQKDKVTAMVAGPEVAPKFRTTPQVVTDSPMDTMMTRIMFSDYIDISFNKAPVRARSSVLNYRNPVAVLVA
jgi:hypothetical protein